MNGLHGGVVVVLFLLLGGSVCHAESTARDVTTNIEIDRSTLSNLPGGSVGAIRGGFGAEVEGGHMTVGVRMKDSTARDVSAFVRIRDSTIVNAGGGNVTIGIDME